MSLCHYIESYTDKVHGRRVSLWQRGEYTYELSKGANHIRWFFDTDIEEVRNILASEHYKLEQL